MVLHMAVVASVKVKLLAAAAAGTSHSLITSIVSGMIWPFVIKVSFRLRSVRRAYAEVSRLFFFQLNQIVRVFDEQPASTTNGSGSGSSDDNNSSSNNSRLERALRLVRETVTNGARRSSEALHLDEQSIHALAMIAL